MELEPTAVQLLSEDGVLTENPEYPLDLSDEQLQRIYRDMVVVRRADTEAMNLQRQGYLKLWCPVLGQEGAQIGSAHALRPGDRAFPQGREFGVGLTVGIEPADMLVVWQGAAQGGRWNIESSGIALYTFPIGSQAAHAVGYGMALRKDGKSAAVVAYIGDGAFGCGEVHEAFLWAANYSSPVVFFSQNNQYAISVPVEHSSPLPLFRRSAGFGFPGVQVDGNDVLACYAVTEKATAQARSGDGPTLIEALTYRIGPHTTSDDPSRYRKADEAEPWRRRDSIERMRTFLATQGLLDEAGQAEAEQEAEQVAASVRTACVAQQDPDPLEMFEHVYAQRPPHLEAEREAWLAFVESTEGAAQALN
jgi:2-oxoisovalerate dehydrogenase E1 component alpha subunit